MVIGATCDAVQNGDSALSVSALRSGVGAVDTEILELLEQRAAPAERSGQYKLEYGLPIRDADRQGRLLANLHAATAARGLSPELVEGVFDLVLRSGDGRDVRPLAHR